MPLSTTLKNGIFKKRLCHQIQGETQLSNVEAVETADTNARIKKKAIIIVLAFIIAAVAAVCIVASLQLSQVSTRLEAVKSTYGIETIGYGTNATELVVTVNDRELKCQMPSTSQMDNRESLKCDDNFTLPAR